MVALPEIIASNERIASTLPPGLVAVFIGGTSGVGEYTVKSFAKHAPKPRVYIVGRSQEAADRIIAECKQLSPGGKFEFIKADVSLVKNVDDVCRQIKGRETSINILFQSQGTMGFSLRTSEGLPQAAATVTHSRMRFILNLLPLIQKATSLRRVVSVLAGTCEGAIDLTNIYAENFPQLKWRGQLASIQTLLLEEAARRAPDVCFVHEAPGIVKGGITRDAQGWTLAFMFAVVRLFAYFLETPPKESGERHVFLATSAMYVPGRGGAAVAGVPLGAGLAVARGTDGQAGSGVYSVDQNGETAPATETVLGGLREDGTAGKVWEVVAADFKKVTGAEVAL